MSLLADLAPVPELTDGQLATMVARATLAGEIRISLRELLAIRARLAAAEAPAG